MKEKEGVILNMASVASSVGLADRFAYNMTKGEVVLYLMLKIMNADYSTFIFFLPYNTLLKYSRNTNLNPDCSYIQMITKAA